MENQQKYRTFDVWQRNRNKINGLKPSKRLELLFCAFTYNNYIRSNILSFRFAFGWRFISVLMFFIGTNQFSNG